MYKSLLVPLDGSPFAEQAFPLAINIATQACASLQVIAVIPHRWYAYLLSKDVLDHWTKALRLYLERIAERVHNDCNIVVNSAVLQGDSIASEISTHAERSGADVIIMATHGRGALGRFWFGSVSYGLMRISSKPLLLVKTSGNLSVWDDNSVPQHMLVLLDGSSLAERMIEPTISLGSLIDADYTFLRVIDAIPLGSSELDSISLASPASVLLRDIQSLQERLLKQSHDYLEGVAERLRNRGLRVKTRVTSAIDPGDAILDVIAAPEFDLVALEHHGGSELPKSAIGSIARKVLHGSMKPIFVSSADITVQSSK